MKRSAGTTSRNPELASAIDDESVAKFSSPAVAAQIRAARRRVEALLPGRTRVVREEDVTGTSLRDFSVALELVGVVADQLQADNEELAAVLKGAEEDLRHYRDLFVQAPGGSLVTDEVGTIVEANEASSALLHSGGKGLSGRRVAEFLVEAEPAEDGETLTAQLDHLQDGMSVHGWEVRVQPEGAARFPATIDVSAARDTEGRISSLHWQLHDITDRKLAEDELEFKASHDGLTGLPNRAAFEEHLALAVARARRRDLAVAVLYLDLDDFKEVNDVRGHAAGDEVLRQLGYRLRRISRDTDLVARLGGDEFAILLSDLTRDEAAGSSQPDPLRPTPLSVADRVQEALAARFRVSGAEIVVGGSIGISVFPTDAPDEAALFEAADAAMYRSKYRGSRRRPRLRLEVHGPPELASSAES
jgi:diguanylate cyclase (GGDEF)-like protein/PAS domain S-box-containing protein